jgi:small subunit ribosomal protein S1
VLELDVEKRQLRLSMKQLVPTGLDEYIAEHKAGDVVTGRLIDESGDRARVELGEGIRATCRVTAVAAAAQPEATATAEKLDMSSLSAMLKSRWQGGAVSSAVGTEAKPEALRAGQIRSFRIVQLDAAAKKIEVELA